MNTHDNPTDLCRFPKLLYAPLGLIIVALAMRGVASPLTVVAVDLLALGLGALAGWLGGEFVTGREPYSVSRAAARFSSRKARPRVRAASRAS